MPNREKKTKRQLWLLILAMAGILFLIIRLRSKVPSLEVEEAQVFAPVTLDTSVIVGNKFKELRAFGAYPIRSGRVGRENPFIPPSLKELEGREQN